MSRKFLSKPTLLAISLVLFAGCTKKATENTLQTSSKPTKELNVAIWSNYLSPEVEKKFTEQTGIKLNISNYASNEELLAKLQAGGAGYDVAVPSDYMVEILAKQGLLETLDNSKLSNTSNVNPAFLKQSFDSENKYSRPYSWSTAGIAINRELFKGKIDSWRDVFENKELEGKVSLLDDVREVTAAALKMNGYSVNTVDKKQLEKAKSILKSAKARVKMFRSDTIDVLLNKEVAVAQSYSTDALQAVAKSNGKIEYVLPKDGGTRAIDNLVILKGSQRTEEAHQFINFLLSEEANISFVQNVFGGPVLKNTKEKLPENIQAMTALFPPQEVLSKFEAIKDLGDQTEIYDRLWTEIKSE